MFKNTDQNQLKLERRASINNFKNVKQNFVERSQSIKNNGSVTNRNNPSMNNIL